MNFLHYFLKLFEFLKNLDFFKDLIHFFLNFLTWAFWALKPIVLFFVGLKFGKGWPSAPINTEEAIDHFNEIIRDLEFFLLQFFLLIFPIFFVVFHEQKMILVINFIIGSHLGVQEKQKDSQGVKIILDKGEFLARNQLRWSILGSTKSWFFVRTFIDNIFPLFISWSRGMSKVNDFHDVVIS